MATRRIISGTIKIEFNESEQKYPDVYLRNLAYARHRMESRGDVYIDTWEGDLARIEIEWKEDPYPEEEGPIFCW